MSRTSELLFVDPGVFDLDTILGNLRPEVEAIVLDAGSPVARQMAAVLEHRHGLDAVHVIAHGAPGKVIFSSGEWSAVTVADDAADLATVGQALAADGELRLWSCDAGVGALGERFVECVAQASGADVVAASGRIGAAALGGRWELTARACGGAAQPPLTAAGVAGYAGVLAIGDNTLSVTTTTNTVVSIGGFCTNDLVLNNGIFIVEVVNSGNTTVLANGVVTEYGRHAAPRRCHRAR